VQCGAVGGSLAQWKDIRPGHGQPEFGPEGKHFVSGNTVVFIFIFGGAAKLRWAGGAQRPFGVFMSPKRRVRAAHGRARAAKTH
jgi:hypothetical protein